MEGMYWIRIGGIAALILGSVYVLLPTFLGDTEAEIASKASSVQTTAGTVDRRPRLRGRRDRWAILQR